MKRIVSLLLIAVLMLSMMGNAIAATLYLPDPQ